jgi:hypothetical protein
MSTVQRELQRLSGTTLDAQGAANAWAGTSGLSLVAALNSKVSTVGLALRGVLNRIAGGPDRGEVAALVATVLPPKITPAPTAVANAGATATVSFTELTSTPTVTSYRAISSPGGLTATGTGSPLTMTGLTATVVYTFTVRATNIVGNGPESDASNAVTAVA